jgi:hypothetical protein
MKAIVGETYGPPDVLHLERVPLPALPAPGTSSATGAS